MSRSNRLQVWSGSAPSEPAVPRANLSEVAYTGANPDGTGKNCKNCFLWRPASNECTIHEASVVAVATTICSYHVFGAPQDGELTLQNLSPVQPECSGLKQVKDGSACQNCRFFRKIAQLDGRCIAVADPDENNADALVSAIGRCSRWLEAF